METAWMFARIAPIVGRVGMPVRKAKIAATETASVPLEKKIATVSVWMWGCARHHRRPTPKHPSFSI
jgi:hypothetical protein